VIAVFETDSYHLTAGKTYKSYNPVFFVVPFSVILQVTIWRFKRNLTTYKPHFRGLIIYTRPAQLRKLEGPSSQHKFAAGPKCLFHFDVEISLQYGRNSGTTITYSRSSFCNIFYNWQSSRGPYVVQAQI